MARPDQILTLHTIDACLEFHREQLGTPVPAAATISSTATLQKPVCRLYRAVALGTNDEHRDIRNQIQGMELYEYLSVKEQDPAAAAVAEFTQGIGPLQMAAPALPTSQFKHPTPVPRTRKGKKIAGCREIAETVRQGAMAEVERIQNMPALKWTWGVDMDVSELENLKRSADASHIPPHSGYDTSLPDRSESRSMSAVSFQAIDELGYFSDLGHDVQPVPEFDVHLHVPYPDVHPPHKQIQHLVTLYDDPCHDMDAVAVPFTGRPLSPTRFVPPPDHHSRKATERLVHAPSVHDSPAVAFASPPRPVNIQVTEMAYRSPSSMDDIYMDSDEAPTHRPDGTDETDADDEDSMNDETSVNDSDGMDVASRAASLFLTHVAPGSHGRPAIQHDTDSQTSSADGSEDIEVAAKAASLFLANVASDSLASRPAINTNVQDESSSDDSEAAAKAASLFLSDAAFRPAVTNYHNAEDEGSADGTNNMDVVAQAASLFLADDNHPAHQPSVTHNTDTDDEVADSGSEHMELAGRAACLFLANVDGSGHRVHDAVMPLQAARSSPSLSSSSSGSIANRAATAFLTTDSPSSASPVPATAAAATFVVSDTTFFPCSDMGVKSHDKALSDEEEHSEGSVDAVMAAAVFRRQPDQTWGSSMDVDPSSFTMERPGKDGYTAANFTFVPDDWVQ
ncbi:hypothetical protein BYT27DRAFT_7263827 [Phlegmacium glaucopus]|nr:hypothetical protein BYT27DRAFT_7263827 [Phlegmacium glaucopus]